VSFILDVEVEHRKGSFALSARMRVSAPISVVFGPSGSGKSTLLRVLAGLERASGRCLISLKGRVLVDSERGVFVEPQRRSISLVFQDLALFPNMTVLENLLFALPRSARGLKRSTDLALEWLCRFGLNGFEDRYPSQLSRGQRQRVALARAIMSEPDLLLLDEPFSSLDGPMRVNLRRELIKLQREKGIPMIYVSHHLDDVVELGEESFFMESGRLVAVLDRSKLCRSPSPEWGRHILDSFGNVLEGLLLPGEGGYRLFEGEGFRFLVKGGEGLGASLLFVPPSDLKLIYPDLPLSYPLSCNLVEGEIEEVREASSSRFLLIRSGCKLWRAEHHRSSYARLNLGVGKRIRFSFMPDGASVFLKGGA